MESLPSEIITQILEYLPFDDRRELARVNKVFYYASSHPLFARKEILIYQPSVDNLNVFNNFKDMLWKSKRKLLCLKFVNLTFTDDLTIFTNLGNHIISLHLNNLNLLSDSYLDAIAQCCSNLEELELTSLLYVYLTDRDRTPIPKLCYIALDCVLLCDRDFNQIVKFAPNLKHLSIFNCRITGCNLIIQRFYRHSINIDNSLTKYNSIDIFSETNVVYHLNNFVRLNCLSLNEGSSIMYLTHSIHLGLKSLTLDLIDTITSRSIDYDKLNLVLGQCVSLEHLKICYLPVDLLSTVSKLCNLRHLTLTYIDKKLNISNSDQCLRLFVESLKNLKYLRTLSFIRASAFNYLDLPIYPIPECKLKSLTSLDCYLHSNQEILRFGNNLTSLRIRNGNILEAEDLLLLFRNLTYLKHLWIDNCTVLNDEIFIKLPISNLKELTSLKLFSTKISHRCLQHITNTSLKVLILTNVALEPDSPQSGLLEFKQSVHILSRAVPLLTQLELHTDFKSKSLFVTSDLFIYFQTRYLALLKTYFKRMKIFILC
ncbi:PREDICTED: uncharacterized protein LOC107163604 [Diuraphis noxia]|uniref:uncharacterized protein LOC107163604 n=1 Tax=Diuraphis noxia TaxID=143948 RepID=UPI000763AD8C|nr:PREDICTED: uncharacterized protein LOC107163604 [Diuraphis noxia]